MVKRTRKEVAEIIEHFLDGAVTSGLGMISVLFASQTPNWNWLEPNAPTFASLIHL